MLNIFLYTIVSRASLTVTELNGIHHSQIYEKLRSDSFEVPQTQTNPRTVQQVGVVFNQ